MIDSECFCVMLLLEAALAQGAQNTRKRFTG